MNTPTNISEILQTYTHIVEQSLRDTLSQQNNFDMYRYMEYFFGFRDEQLQPTDIYGGKRYRSSLCLLIASFYESVPAAVPTATSIEIYHNFTLIHDDIEDNDTMRRGRPTVWSLWGINHGINTGDAQLLLAQETLVQALSTHGESYVPVIAFLNDCYKQVIEGQFLDFNLTELPLGSPEVTINAYHHMISKKTSVLVGAATQGAAMVAQQDHATQQLWWEYGYHLGMAYQLSDDTFSIWGDLSVTGKENYGDIIEQKKTLPIIYALDQLTDTARDQLLDIYNQEHTVTNEQARTVLDVLHTTDVYEYATNQIQEHNQKSLDALGQIDIAPEHKETLRSLNQALLPNVKDLVQ